MDTLFDRTLEFYEAHPSYDKPNEIGPRFHDACHVIGGASATLGAKVAKRTFPRRQIDRGTDFVSRIYERILIEMLVYPPERNASDFETVVSGVLLEEREQLDTPRLIREVNDLATELGFGFLPTESNPNDPTGRGKRLEEVARAAGHHKEGKDVRRWLEASPDEKSIAVPSLEEMRWHYENAIAIAQEIKKHYEGKRFTLEKLLKIPASFFTVDVAKITLFPKWKNIQVSNIMNTALDMSALLSSDSIQHCGTVAPPEEGVRR